MAHIFLLLLFSFFQHAAAKQAQSEHAEHVLNLVDYALPALSIIGEREWKELELDRLVTILDRTKTSFGRWGLVQLLHPIADEKELLKRKEIITYLIEHEDDMRMFQKQLERVQAVETSLLAYWNKYDQLQQSSGRFYFSLAGFTELNKSSIALNASTIMEGFNSFKDLLQSLALSGVTDEFTRWSLGVQDEFNLMRGVRFGLTEPIMRHSPWLYRLTNAPYTARDAAVALSWGDTYNVYKSGFSYTKADKSTSDVPGLGTVGAFFAATVGVLMSDYQTLNRADLSIKRVVSMFKDLSDLHQRVCDVAQCIDAIKQLNAIVSKKSPQLRSYLAGGYDFNDENKDFIKKLLAPRFLKKTDYFYSRGHVLTMHLEITKNKNTIISLLHSVALLDAYCSIAQLYKENQNESLTFSFPEFVDSATPLLDYKDAWLPLLPHDQAVSNDFVLGGNRPGKIVITGPNGGGKSTILKTLGMAAVLPQSWCIGAFKQGKQSLFTSIKISFAPSENLLEGVSTGVASMKVMDELREDIRASDAQERMLVLIDEPYRGLLDAVAEERIYQFGQDVAQHKQAAVVIATHLKTPILLAQSTGGIFDNYQVMINEISFGIFKRLFKIAHGPAMWWFENAAQRSRFVDWIMAQSSVR